MSSQNGEPSVPENGNAVLARLSLSRPKGKRRQGSSAMAAASMRDRLAELDRYVGAVAANSEEQSSLCGEWSNPQAKGDGSTNDQPIDATTTNGSNHSELSNHTSSSIDKSCSNSNQSSINELINDQQQQGVVEPWQLCPPVSNSPHKCPHCSACYTSKAGLRRHVDSKHSANASTGNNRAQSSSSSSSSSSKWQCEACPRLFYHRSTLARHYTEVHPNFQYSFIPSSTAQNQRNNQNGAAPVVGLQNSQNADFVAFTNGMFSMPSGPQIFAPQVVNPVDSIAAAAAALRFAGITLPVGSLQHFPAGVLGNQTPFAFPEGSLPERVLVHDENSMHRLARDVTPPLATINSAPSVNRLSTAEKTPPRQIPATEQHVEPLGGDGDIVECVFCAKTFPNTNPSLIFHQVVAHKISVESFKTLSPPNCINCPDCSLSLDAKDASFPAHTCPGPKRQSPGLAVLVASMLCDRCGECLHNEDTYAAHREMAHGLFDCSKCFAVMDSQDNLAKHNCRELAPINILMSPEQSLRDLNSPDRVTSLLLSCPLCSDRFTEKQVLAEHVSGYHRTDFALFDKNGLFYLGSHEKTPRRPAAQQQQQLQSPNVPSVSPSKSLQSPSSSPENEIPMQKDDHASELVVSDSRVNGDDQSSLPQSPTFGGKRRPLGVRASAADKWRNVDGFRCAHCRATFLTSQSRAQHVRWRHPEILAKPDGSQSSPDKQLVDLETGSIPEIAQSGMASPVNTPSSTPSKSSRQPGDFDCPVCGSSYISARSRAQHIRWSHPGAPNADDNLLSPTPTVDSDVNVDNNVSQNGGPLPGQLDPALAASLATGYKGSCEICGVHLANSQGRSQHIRHKHPEAWQLIRRSTSRPIPSSTNSVNEAPPATLANNGDVGGEDSVEIPNDLLDDSGDENGSFPCMFCDKTFSSKRGRGRHYYWIHQRRQKDYSGPFPTNGHDIQVLAARLSGGMEGAATTEAPSATRWFSCSRCPKRFLRRVGLSIHMAQAHRRSSDEMNGATTKNTAPGPDSSSPPQVATLATPERPSPSKKSVSPSAMAQCLLCDNCFSSQSEVIRHLLDSHNISNPTDAHWVWAVTHTDVEGDDDDDYLEDGDFVRETVTTESLPEDLSCAACQKSFPNELLFRGHMMLEHQVDIKISTSDVRSNPSDMPLTSVSTTTSKTMTTATSQPSSSSVAPVADVVHRCSDCNKAFGSSRALHIHEHHTQHGPHRPPGKEPPPPPLPTAAAVNLPVPSRKRAAADKIEAVEYELENGNQTNGKGLATGRRGSLPAANHTADENNTIDEMQCGVCRRNFASTRALHIHQKMTCLRHVERSPKDVVAASSAESQVDLSEAFPCDLCDEVFSRPQGLACHKRSRHNYVSMSPRSVASRQKTQSKISGQFSSTSLPSVPSFSSTNSSVPICRGCGSSFTSKFAFVSHSNGSSKCGTLKFNNRRCYLGRVWAAIRLALASSESAKQKRRETVDSWLRRHNLERSQPLVVLPPSSPLEEKRTRRSNRRPSTPPKRSPGRRTSPLLPAKHAKEKKAKEKVGDPSAAASEKPTVKQRSKKDAGCQNRCVMCAREFLTPVQLMIHYCRDNCASQVAQPAIETVAKVDDDSDQLNSPISVPKLPGGADMAALIGGLPRPKSNDNESMSSQFPTAGSNNAPSRKARMKRPTFDGDTNSERPSQATFY